MTGRRIKVKGVRKEEIDSEKMAMIFWIMAKRQVEEKRAREQEQRDEQRAKKAVAS